MVSGNSPRLKNCEACRRLKLSSEARAFPQQPNANSSIRIILRSTRLVYSSPRFSSPTLTNYEVLFPLSLEFESNASFLQLSRTPVSGCTYSPSFLIESQFLLQFERNFPLSLSVNRLDYFSFPSAFCARRYAAQRTKIEIGNNISRILFRKRSFSESPRDRSTSLGIGFFSFFFFFYIDTVTSSWNFFFSFHSLRL